ncbi:hypothetical protein [Geomonas sp.]|uniref:hypothetical protein n=1 Tax=Geomonas sp. TaxID=2651584 RepID=UPI002B47F4ED|nr:hypothetical protein [Geomonas sp.]HJV34231.1 hypothetical protein [Geomonas sp.]
MTPPLRLKVLITTLLCVVCCAGGASAATLEQLTPFFTAQHYTWKEYYGGRRLLDEDGPLFSGGVKVGILTDLAMTITAKAEVFGGVISYDGETQAPNPVPVKTDVTYVGTRGEADFGYRLPPDLLNFEPFAGIGYRWWTRDLHDSQTATGVPVSGYTETWDSVYCRLGARGSYRPSSDWTMYVEGGGKYPFYTGNSVDFAGAGTVTFHPGSLWSGFAEAGASYRNLKVAFTYEGFRWSQSPLKRVGYQAFFQPESTSDIMGLSLGWNFR